MKHIIERPETNFEPEALNAPNPVAVDYYAPQCGPCKMITPLQEQFACGRYLLNLQTKNLL